MWSDQETAINITTRTCGMASLQWAVAAILLIALVGEATAFQICGIDSAQLKLNEGRPGPAVTGKSPKPPTKKCCNVVRQANLRCLCNYKSVLPTFGIDPALAMALPRKCGMKAPRKFHVV